ncbi:MAG: transglutaminase family protein, partial [Promethearchaeota archaeon]
VTYQVEINFTLTQTLGSGNYYFKFPRINDRLPNSLDTKYTPPYQDSELLYNNITGYDVILLNSKDKFNNTYDWFNATLGVGEKVSISQKYIVGLNAIKFSDISESEIGTYDTSDEMFELYCNKTETCYERNDTSLISLSNSIVNPSDNPIEKAKKICNWVSDNLEYTGDLTDEMGALWAYTNLKGDCSEFSSLMITLLRIQNIPARKVTGYLVSNNPSLRPKPGDIWSFDANEIMGHAWMEYYVPDIGWIACDPLWDYFNRIDYLRFNINVGANFFFPPSSIISEFNRLYSYTSMFHDYDYSITITVIESNLAPLDSIPLMFYVFIGIGAAAILITIFLIIRIKKHKG